MVLPSGSTVSHEPHVLPKGLMVNSDPAVVQVNLSPDSYLYRMNDVSRELYIVANGEVELLIEQDDQLDFVESTRSAGQVYL